MISNSNLQTPGKWGPVVWLYMYYISAAFDRKRAQQFGAAIISTCAILPCESCSQSSWNCLSRAVRVHSKMYKKTRRASALISFLTNADSPQCSIPSGVLSYFDTLSASQAMKLVFIFHSIVTKKNGSEYKHTFDDITSLFECIENEPCVLTFEIGQMAKRNKRQRRYRDRKTVTSDYPVHLNDTALYSLVCKKS